jgi:hypothetical protein
MENDIANLCKFVNARTGKVDFISAARRLKNRSEAEGIKLSAEELVERHDGLHTSLGFCEVDLLVFGDVHRLAQLEGDLKNVIWSFVASRSDNGASYSTSYPLISPSSELRDVFTSHPEFTFVLHCWYVSGGPFELAVWEHGAQTYCDKGEYSSEDTKKFLYLEEFMSMP